MVEFLVESSVRFDIDLDHQIQYEPTDCQTIPECLLELHPY